MKSVQQRAFADAAELLDFRFDLGTDLGVRHVGQFQHLRGGKVLRQGQGDGRPAQAVQNALQLTGEGGGGFRRSRLHIQRLLGEHPHPAKRRFDQRQFGGAAANIERQYAAERRFQHPVTAIGEWGRRVSLCWLSHHCK